MRTLRLTHARELGALSQLMSVHLRSVHVFLSQGLVAEMELRGLKSGSVSALSLIAANPGISQNEVGETIGIDRSTMVQVMDALEGRGSIVRRKSQTDRRRYSLYVTDEGRDMLDQIVSSVKRAEEAMLQAIPASDLEQLRQLVERVRGACHEALERAEVLGDSKQLYRQV